MNSTVAFAVRDVHKVFFSSLEISRVGGLKPVA